MSSAQKEEGEEVNRNVHLRALQIFRDDERTLHGRRYRGGHTSEKLTRAFGALDHCERQSYVMRAKGFHLESQTDDSHSQRGASEAATSGQRRQPLIDQFLKDQVARAAASANTMATGAAPGIASPASLLAPEVGTMETLPASPGTVARSLLHTQDGVGALAHGVVTADQEGTLVAPAQPLQYSRAELWNNARAWGFVDGLSVEAKANLPTDSLEGWTDAQPLEHYGSENDMSLLSPLAEVGAEAEMPTSPALSEEAVTAPAIGTSTCVQEANPLGQRTSAAANRPVAVTAAPFQGQTHAPWHGDQRFLAGGSTLPCGLLPLSSYIQQGADPGHHPPPHQMSPTPLPGVMTGSAFRGVPASQGTLSEASFQDRWRFSGAPWRSLGPQCGSRAPAFQGTSPMGMHQFMPQGGLTSQALQGAPSFTMPAMMGFDSVVTPRPSVSFPGRPLLLPGHASFHTAGGVPHVTPDPTTTAMVQAAMQHLTAQGTAKGGVHIMRSLKCFQDGSYPNKEQILEIASATPPGGALLKPHTILRQVKNLPHGDVQLTTPCGRAHVKVHFGSGSIDVCGAKPELALPYIEGWTADEAVPSRRKKRKGGDRF